MYVSPERLRALARTIARQTPRRLEHWAHDVEDLEQDAALGIMQATRSYDPERGIPFEIYARRRVRGEIADGRRRLDRLPRELRERQTKLLGLWDDLAQQLGHEPSVAELGLAAGVAPAEVSRLLGCDLFDPVSLDRAPHGPLIESIKGREEPAVDELALGRIDRELLDRELTRLPGPEQFVLRARWFLDMTSPEVGQLMRISESRVRQLQRAGLERLQEQMGDDQP